MSPVRRYLAVLLAAAAAAFALLILASSFSATSSNIQASIQRSLVRRAALRAR